MTPALPITLEQYLGKYLEHPDCTPGVKGNAIVLLDLVNAGLLLAQGDGVQLRINPITGSLVAGSGNGGFRPDECPIGALASWHKRHYRPGRARELGPAACDVYDPARELVAWSLENKARWSRSGSWRWSGRNGRRPGAIGSVSACRAGISLSCRRRIRRSSRRCLASSSSPHETAPRRAWTDRRADGLGALVPWLQA
jgi:hypothetical protein